MSILKSTYNSTYGKKPHEIILECGVDEAGVGCLSGPVVSAAVIFPYEIDEEYRDCEEYKLLKDSKKLTEHQREKIQYFIKEVAIDWNVAFVDNVTVDDINIRNARFLSMRNAIDGLCIVPEFLLIDGDVFPDSNKLKLKTPHKCIIGGDNIYQSIAAASIIAKCARDEYMIGLSKDYPEYGWNTNKGYGTKAHYLALKKHGVTPFHRTSFNLNLQKTNYIPHPKLSGNKLKKIDLNKCLIDDSDDEVP